MKIGVLALQGAFREHIQALKQLGVDTLEVRTPEQLGQVDGLIIPGGESTTIGKLMVDFGLKDLIIQKAAQGMPILGTCAGMIVLAKDICGSEQTRLGLMDITVKRNAFGRQCESFETDLSIKELGAKPYKAVFIRAPYVEKVDSDVEVLAVHENKIVYVKQGNLLGIAFHPELTEDLRVHQYFINLVNRQAREKKE